MDQPSPFHPDPFLLHQSPTFPDPTTSLGVQFYQPSHQQQLLTNTHFIGNELQILDSSLPVDVLHNPTSQLKMPTATCSINQTAQSTTLAKATSKRRQQKKSKDSQENEKKKKIDSKEGQTGYIHVRARRGEATDSHSIAERIRREKINEKMKTLQSIVPGCDKITGKALMLDEVINYVQSLQSEIQLLSSKLATVYPMYDYGAQYEECMLEPQYDDIITMQQGPLSFQEQQMSCVTSQNSGETMWDLEDERQQLDDDLFAIINCNSFHYK